MRRNVAVLLSGGVLLAACHKPPVPLAPVPANANSDSLNRARADSIAEARRAEMARAKAEQDSLRALRDQNGAGTADAMSVLSATIYSDYDQAQLTDTARALLLAKAKVMQSQPGLRVRIIGNTDERGSSEYNLALGLRRAAEAKAFLVANGADASHIEISSMGEEQPAVQGDSEEAWSRNRRAEFVPLSGSEGK
ncbi:MAG: OmpA family protein [Gemmatimonadaceae bacterium]